MDEGTLVAVFKHLRACYYDNSSIFRFSSQYEGVIRELLEIYPSPTPYDIYVRQVAHETEGEAFSSAVAEREIDVFLYCRNEKEIFAIDPSEWNLLIDATITDLRASRDGGSLPDHELLAHILWEITFYGFTQSQVSEARIVEASFARSFRV